jgi:hypothetical protein
MGVPAYRITTGDESESLHCARRREATQTGALLEVDPGPWSGIETGGARDSREAICGCVLWGAHRWEIAYRCVRSYWRRRSSTLQVHKARDRGEEQHGGRASSSVECRQSGTQLETVSDCTNPSSCTKTTCRVWRRWPEEDQARNELVTSLSSTIGPKSAWIAER